MLGLDFWTANDSERRDEEREGELQESDGDAEDHLIEFVNRLETGIKCFQRQVQTTDKKVQEARRQTTTTPNHLEGKDVEKDDQQCNCDDLLSQQLLKSAEMQGR